jgi:SOS-response transcriptional repressor LexA
MAPNKDIVAVAIDDEATLKRALRKERIEFVLEEKGYFRNAQEQSFQDKRLQALWR